MTLDDDDIRWLVGRLRNGGRVAGYALAEQLEATIGELAAVTMEVAERGRDEIIWALDEVARAEAPPSVVELRDRLIVKR